MGFKKRVLPNFSEMLNKVKVMTRAHSPVVLHSNLWFDLSVSIANRPTAWQILRHSCQHDRWGENSQRFMKKASYFRFPYSAGLSIWRSFTTSPQLLGCGSKSWAEVKHSNVTRFHCWMHWELHSQFVQLKCCCRMIQSDWSCWAGSLSFLFSIKFSPYYWNKLKNNISPCSDFKKNKQFQ